MKPREFWLTNIDDEYDHGIYLQNPNYDWAIHVIEYSAYKALLEQAKMLAKTLQDSCACLITEGKLNQEDCHNCLMISNWQDFCKERGIE